MNFRIWHWLGALVVAAAAHAGLAWWLYAAAPEPPKGTPGEMRVRIAGSQAAPGEPLPETSQAPEEEAQPAEPETARPETTEAESAEPTQATETEPVEETPETRTTEAAPTTQATAPAPEAPPAEPTPKEAEATPKRTVQSEPEPRAEPPEPVPEPEPPETPPEPAPEEPAPESEAPAEEPPEETAATTQEAPGDTEQTRETPREGPPGQEASEPRGMPDSERDAYANKVRALLERHKEYPRRARVQYIEGQVVLRITVAHDGEVRSVAVAEGSGYRVLDQAAEEMARKASPLPAPEELDSGTIDLVVPVSYRLN